MTRSAHTQNTTTTRSKSRTDGAYAMKKTLAILLAVLPAVALAGRNSSGSYSLPSGNPVATGTSISSTWANNTLGDIATTLTSSLDRNGRGGMLAPMRVPDGSAAFPSLSFSSESTSGWYRAGAGDERLSILGSDRLQVTASGATVTGAFAWNVASVLPTCDATAAGRVYRLAGSGVTRSRLCLCAPDAQGSPTYAWQNAGSGAVGSSTSCPDNTYQIGVYVPGVPDPSQVVARVAVTQASHLPTGLTGSQFFAGSGSGTLTITLKKRTAGGVTTTIGTVAFSGPGAAGTATFSSDVDFAAGDFLEFVAPGSAGTLADFSMTVVATRI